MFFPPLSSSNARTVCMRARVSCIYGRFVARDETNRKKRETAGRRRERTEEGGKKRSRTRRGRLYARFAACSCGGTSVYGG